MKCPRCAANLSAARVGSLELDICHVCAGSWFDRFELDRVDEVHEKLGEYLLDEIMPRESILVATAARLHCPRDTDVVMMRRSIAAGQKIMVDECPACGGVWLDAGELGAIRAHAEK